jgi:hypothetical protein
MTVIAKKSTQEFLAGARDVTDPQIAAFAEALGLVYAAKNELPGSYPQVPYLSNHDAEQRALAASLGFDLDNAGNIDAVRASDAWAQVVAPFKAANDAYNEQRAREAKAKRDASLDVVCAALSDNPAIVRAIRAAAASPGSRIDEFKIGTAFGVERLKHPTNPYGGATTGYPAYVSVAKPSGCKLEVNRAVGVGYSQESYADYSTTLIPVVLEGQVDQDASRGNLRHLANSLQTHNGFAGSGSTYQFELKIEDDGAYVIMVARHSISD